MSCAEFCKLHQVSKGQIYKWRQYFLSQEKLMVERSAFILDFKASIEKSPSLPNVISLNKKYLDTQPDTNHQKFPVMSVLPSLYVISICPDTKPDTFFDNTTRLCCFFWATERKPLRLASVGGELN